MLLPKAPKLLDSETSLPFIAYPSHLIKALSQESPTVRVSLELGGHRIAKAVEDLSWSKDALWSEEDAFMAKKVF